MRKWPTTNQVSAVLLLSLLAVGACTPVAQGPSETNRSANSGISVQGAATDQYEQLAEAFAEAMQSPQVKALIRD